MPARVKTSDDGMFKTASAEIAGTTYTFRELSVKDNDAALAASKQPDGGYDTRLMMRLMVTKTSVEPKLNDEALALLPQRVYLKICDVVNELNSDDEPEDDDEGND